MTRRQCVDCRKRARTGDWYCGECSPDAPLTRRPPAPDPTAAESATIARFGIFAEEEGRHGETLSGRVIWS